MPDNVMTPPTDVDLGVKSFEDTLAEIKAGSESAKAAEAADNSALEAAISSKESENPAASTEAEAFDEVEAAAAKAGFAAPPAKSEPVVPRLKRIMDKEAALIEREAKIADLERRAGLVASAEQQFRLDPVGYLKKLRPDLDAGALAKQLWYHELGDQAPKEQRAEMEAVKASQTVEQLREELASTKTQILAEIEQRQAEAAFAQYQGALAAYAEAPPETVPLVQKYAAKKPEKVAQALLKVAQRHARATGGEVLSPAQAATKLEEALREVQLSEAAGTTETVATPPTTPAKAAPVPPNTLRNKHTSVQPSRVVEDSLDDEVLSKRAMAALEHARKQRAGQLA